MAFHPKWSTEEINILKTYNDIDTLVKLLPRRTKSAIEAKRVAVREWTEEEIALFPKTTEVTAEILKPLAAKLSVDSRALWNVLKARGHVWSTDSSEGGSQLSQEYPMHGKPWTNAELALFPADKTVPVTKEVLNEIIAKIPTRKPTSIWPRMKKEGYIWDTESEEATTETKIGDDEALVLSIAYELGFKSTRKPGQRTLTPELKNVEDRREQIAKKFELSKDFTSAELLYKIMMTLSPLPWDQQGYPEVLEAYRNPTHENKKKAAKVLYDYFGSVFLDG